jgi:hypothetical protein
MIRNFNYTGRKRIPRTLLDFSLADAELGPLLFRAKLRLDSLNLPKDAAVYVEAYHSIFVMRFPFGRVGKIEVPRDRLLRELPTREVVHFRVKVVDETSEHGRILAEADRITATRSGKLSLLHVDPLPLGDQVWRLNLDDLWPKMEVNSEIRDVNMFEIVRSNTAFRSLALPAILREILTHLVLREPEVDMDTKDHWGSNWYRFGQSLLGGMPCPTGADEEALNRKIEWIEDVVKAFCNKHGIAQMFKTSTQQGVV